MMSRKYTSKPISLPTSLRERAFKHADLQFFNVDHSGASYQGRVFFNNPHADDKTPLATETGYAGSFHVFGHGGCFGDVGHCDVHERRPFDTRLPHPLTPTTVSVDVTDGLRIAILKREPLTITVVPIILSGNDKCDLKDCFHFNGFRLQIRNPHGDDVSMPIESTAAALAGSPSVFAAPVSLSQLQAVSPPERGTILSKKLAIKSAFSKAKTKKRSIKRKS